jgi:biotin transport system substrate-specific component
MKGHKMNNKIDIKTIVRTGMFAAITASLSQIAIPMPSGVPATLQTFAIAFCGFMLGWKTGLISVFAYIMLGAVGVPVFANFKGGAGVLFGMTGGFIWGFLFLTFFSGLGSKLNGKVPALGLSLIGLVVCHLLGVMQFAAVTSTPVLKSFLLVSAPYIFKDAVSAVLACGVSIAVKKRLASAHLI